MNQLLFHVQTVNIVLMTAPKNINIPAYFSIYNSYNLYGDRNFPSMHYDRQSHGRGKASECIECKMCEGHCPQHIEITEKLKLVAEAFEI